MFLGTGISINGPVGPLILVQILGVNALGVDNNEGESIGKESPLKQPYVLFFFSKMYRYLNIYNAKAMLILY